jgi:hypothetical protein
MLDAVTGSSMNLCRQCAIIPGSDMGWFAVGYVTPAKGMTLLNYSGLKLDFIVDDNA